MLSLLVAHRRIRRELAAELLWPELDDPRHNLRVTLNYLRRVLEPGGIGSERYLHADQQIIALAAGRRVRCDVWELADHLDEAAAAERAGDQVAALHAYGLVVPLWRGDPYQDHPDHDWIRNEQTRWRERFLAAAVRAGELHLAAGDTLAAAFAAERALAAEPTDERAHQLAIGAPFGAGDLDRAQRAPAACERALAELGVRPSARTVQLADQLARELTAR